MMPRWRLLVAGGRRVAGEGTWWAPRGMPKAARRCAEVGELRVSPHCEGLLGEGDPSGGAAAKVARGRRGLRSGVTAGCSMLTAKRLPRLLCAAAKAWWPPPSAGRGARWVAGEGALVSRPSADADVLVARFEAAPTGRPEGPEVAKGGPEGAVAEGSRKLRRSFGFFFFFCSGYVFRCFGRGCAFSFSPS